MNTTVMQGIEQCVFNAIKNHSASTLLYSTSVPSATLESAYQLQAAVNSLLVASGERIIGWKAGLTNVKAQQAFGVTHPVYAPLLARGLYNDGKIPHPAPLPTHLEGEVVLRFGKDCPAYCNTIDQLLPLIDSVHFGFEIVSRRLVGSKTLVDLIADNVAATGVKISSRRFSPEQFDFSQCGLQLIGPAGDNLTGTSADVMGNPLYPVLGLVRHLQQRGQHIAAGDIVFSGSMVMAMNVQPGDHCRLKCFQGNELIDETVLTFMP